MYTVWLFFSWLDYSTLSILWQPPPRDLQVAEDKVGQLATATGTCFTCLPAFLCASVHLLNPRRCFRDEYFDNTTRPIHLSFHRGRQHCLKHARPENEVDLPGLWGPGIGTAGMPRTAPHSVSGPPRPRLRADLYLRLSSPVSSHVRGPSISYAWCICTSSCACYHSMASFFWAYTFDSVVDWGCDLLRGRDFYEIKATVP